MQMDELSESILQMKSAAIMCLVILTQFDNAIKMKRKIEAVKLTSNETQSFFWISTHENFEDLKMIKGNQILEITNIKIRYTFMFYAYLVTF